LDRPPDQLIDELVELGRANDPDRERTVCSCATFAAL